MAKQIHLINVIPAPQGAFLLETGDITPIDIIAYFYSDYDGRYHECPMFFEEMNDFTDNACDGDKWQQFFSSHKVPIRTCLTRNLLAHVLKYEVDKSMYYDNNERLLRFEQLAVTGEIKCTKQVYDFLCSDSTDIEDCEEDVG